MNNPDVLALQAGPIRPKEPGGACRVDLLATPGLPDLAALDSKLSDAAALAALEARAPSLSWIS